MKITTASIYLLLIISLTVAFAPGCLKVKNPETKGPATLSEVTTATSVSAEGKPLSVATNFLASTPTIYVCARVNNAPQDTSLGAKWIYVIDSTGKEVSQELFSDGATVSGTKYVSFNHQSPAGSWAPGKYSVALYLNNQEVTDAQFTVQAVQRADVPAPTIYSFKAVPEAINYGQAVTLSWSTSDASKVELSTVGSVQATGNVIVAPANSTEYTLTASNAAGSTTMKVKIQVTSFISDKPELVVTDFWAEGDRVYYKIKNISEVAAKSSASYLYIEGNYKASSLVEVLAPNQERTQTFPNFQWTYGSQRTYRLPLRVCADARNEVGEYDENNNCLVLDW